MVSILRKTFAQEARETRGPPHFPSEQHQDPGPSGPTETRPEERLLSDIQFGFMAGKSSVDQLCLLMDELESKKGKAGFLLSIDLKGAMTDLTMSSSIAS
jgi:hypothetical protein